MTDTITLPRSVVEQALEMLNRINAADDDRDFLTEDEAVCTIMAIDELDAALRAALDQHQHESNSDKHLQEKTDHLSTTRSSVPPGWKLVGWWHQVEDPDECDFFYADAINGDCPSCHPCYADIGGEE